MSASGAEVARPTLRPRGLLGVAEPILTAGGRAVGQHTEAFVGIDAAKARDAIAVAEGGAAGEVRYLGEVDASEPGMQRIVARLAAKYDRVHFCYEAGRRGGGGHEHRRRDRHAVFLAFTEQVLVPALRGRPDAIVVMDDLAAHKAEAVRGAL